jgi:uncharacterized protein DUF1549/uncharacterized protein DUF1553/cytochrome c
MRWVSGALVGLALSLGAVLAWAQETPRPETTAAGAKAPDASAVQFFETKIRPLLAQQCYACHSEKNVRGGLKLDSAAAFFKGGETGPLVTSGAPDKSLLIQAVSYTKDHLKMPPQGKLKPQQLADLNAWVQMGAPFPEDEGGRMKDEKGSLHPSAFIPHPSKHWAFQPVKEPAIPAVKDQSWVVSSIDAFILARLEAKGLLPAPKADRRTLVRRVTFDLTGLPPTPEEIEAFLADNSPDAFAKVVDRLLASPAYGERWARHWLDVARYADSNGLDENTAFGNAWRYRDYVVDAFNNDKPYDQFVREQLAGDLIPASPDDAVNAERLTATGFLVVGPKVLAEPDKQKMVMDIVDEQIDTTGRAFMGLTLGCARCHDHKFDPIPTKDYYSLAGIFKSTRTMATLATVARALERPIADRDAVAGAEAHNRAVQNKQDEIKKLTDRLNAEASTGVLSNLEKYLLAGLHAAVAPAAEPAPAPAAPNGRLRNRTPADLAKESGLDPEILRRSASYLLASRERGGDLVFEPWHLLSDLPADRFAEEARKLAAEWQATGKSKAWLPPVAALFAGEAPKSLAEVAARYGKLFREVDRAWNDLVQRSRRQPVRLRDGDQEALRQVLYGGQSAFGLDRPERFYPAEAGASLNRLKAEIQDLQKAAPQPVPMVLAVEEDRSIGSVKVHIRGNHLTLGEEAPRQFLRVIVGEKQTPIGPDRSGRLELAEWLTRLDHPLTARVMVNRIWGHHFGEAIARSTDNFGLLGDRPTHPELLDWLAAEFAEGVGSVGSKGSVGGRNPTSHTPHTSHTSHTLPRAWSIKRMHRLILLSNTYQMSTAHDPKAALADPENRLLWRFNRRRLEVEAIRDSMLAVSGELDRTMGGTLLKTPNFGYVTNDQSGNAAQYDSPRRSIYLPVIRNAVYDVFQVFDFVEPSLLTGKRASTTVAPQALFMLNGQFVLDQSKAFAGQLLASTTDDAARIRTAYLKVYGRAPAPEEVSAAQEYLSAYADRLAAKETDPEKRRQAAWASYCQILFASNEFVYVN